MGQPATLKLDFTGGLWEHDEVTLTQPKYASALQNWIAEPSGSLRVPRGWLSASTTGLSGTRTVRGIVYYAGTTFIVAIATSGTQYKLQSIVKSNLPAATWGTVETVTSNPSTRPLAMAAGLGLVLHSSPEYPSSRIRTWNGTSAADASTDAIAGRALAFHNNRFFVGGATTDPTFLRWSELGDAGTWTVATNFQPINQDDGEPIEDLVSWDRGLMIGKENSIQYLTGFGPDTFAFHPLDGGGVAPGRTLIPTPSGVIAIGRKRIWAFTGGGFEPISLAIENSYGMTGNYMSGAYIDGEVYVCDEGSGRVWVLNMASKTWRTEIFGTVADGPGIVRSFADYLLGGKQSGSTGNSVLLYRQMPGTARARIVGSSQTFQAVTGQLWLGEAEGPFQPRHLYVQLRQRGGTSADTPVTVKHYVDGVLDLTLTMALSDAGAGVYRHRLDLRKEGYSHQVEFSQVVSSSSSGIVDIESAILDGQLEAPR